jgi:branched-chain amino acid aminotransferase
MVFGTEHLARLRESSLALDLGPLPTDAELQARVSRLLHADELQFGAARVMLRLDRRHLLIRCAGVPVSLERDRSEGVGAISVRHSPPPSAAHKVLFRPFLRAAASWARAAGVGEALLFDQDDRLLEGATSSVFCVRKGCLETTPLSAGILPGVTRDQVMRLARHTGLEPRELDLDRQAVLEADEVFLTSAVRLLVPVVRLDGAPIGGGLPGPVGRSLQRALWRAVAPPAAD